MTSRSVRKILIQVTLAGAVAAALWAQAMTQMTGTLIGLDGKPIVGAEVKITRTDIKANYNIKTNKDGKFNYATLPLGVYDVVITAGADLILDTKGVRTDYSKPTVMDIDRRKVQAANAAAAAAPAAPGAPGAAPPAPTAEQTEAEKKRAEEAQAKYDKEMKEYNEQQAKNSGLQTAFNAGMEAAKVKNWPVAIENFTKASELDPTQHAVFAQLADAYKIRAESERGAERLADFNKSAEAYAKAIALKPDDSTYRYNGSVVYARANKMAEAQAELDKAMTLDPTRGAIGYRNLGAVYFDTNRGEAAEVAYRKSIELDPRAADSYFQLGLVLIGRATVNGDKMVAPPGTAEALQKYLELAPTGAESDNAKGMLEALGSPVVTGINRTPPKDAKGAKGKGK
ncbi:MAG: carboxypeptidase regulatory-like domain-containing protein [Acidobacteriota bacterium]